MRIVNLQQFLAMPDNTLFSKYSPCYFEGLQIKVANCGERDFLVQEIADSIDCNDSGEFTDKLDDAMESGVSLTMDFESSGRDGCFVDDQLFAVYDRADVEALIKRLERCLPTQG